DPVILREVRAGLLLLRVPRPTADYIGAVEHGHDLATGDATGAVDPVDDGADLRLTVAGIDTSRAELLTARRQVLEILHTDRHHVRREARTCRRPQRTTTSRSVRAPRLTRSPAGC